MNPLQSLFLFLLFPVLLQGQRGAGVPVTLESPYNTMYVHLYYLEEDSFQPEIAGRTLYGVSDSTRASRLAVKLKQILDGKGLYVQLNLVPQNPNYIDSTSQNAVFTPFPQQMPEVYLEKVNGLWYYSEATVENIPALHKEVYPFGTDLLLNLLPRLGQTKVLGLATWQYLGLLILLVLALLLHLLINRLLNPVAARYSRSRFSLSQVEPETIARIVRIISVLVILRFIRVFCLPYSYPSKRPDSLLLRSILLPPY